MTDLATNGITIRAIIRRSVMDQNLIKLNGLEVNPYFLKIQEFFQLALVLYQNKIAAL